MLDDSAHKLRRYRKTCFKGIEMFICPSMQIAADAIRFLYTLAWVGNGVDAKCNTFTATNAEQHNMTRLTSKCATRLNANFATRALRACKMLSQLKVLGVYCVSRRRLRFQRTAPSASSAAPASAACLAKHPNHCF